MYDALLVPGVTWHSSLKKKGEKEVYEYSVAGGNEIKMFSMGVRF